MKPRRALGATKLDAHVAVQRARVDGLLPRRPPHCEACGAEGRIIGCRWSVQLHHRSYLPEHHLDVVAVCRRCHGLIHAGKLSEPAPNLYSAEKVAALALALGPVHVLRPRRVVAREPKRKPKRVSMWGKRRELLLHLVQHRPGILQREAAKALGCGREYVAVLCRELGIDRVPTAGGFALYVAAPAAVSA